MKRIYLVRHAKSSWADPTTDDFDRPLNERGKKDAPFMAKLLADRSCKPQVIISSPAKRTRKTSKIFCETLELPENNIEYIEKLYLSPSTIFFDIIEQLENNINEVIIVAHNPGITDFANTLCEGVHIDNIPTCGIFAVETNINSWGDFRSANKEFLFFIYPKAF